LQQKHQSTKAKLTNSENQYEKPVKSLTQFSLNVLRFFLSPQIHLQSIHNWRQQSRTVEQQQMEHVDAGAGIQQTHSKNTKLQNEVA